MSTAPKHEVAFIQENQNKVEHSALFYLFQEVSKLDPPLHDSFLDTDPPSRWLNEVSKSRRFSHKRADDDEPSFRPPRGTCKYSLSCVLPYGPVKDASERGGDVPESDEPRCECGSSPWKVLSLINLHCERLLHQRDDEEDNSTSAPSNAGTSQSMATLAPHAPPNGVDGESEPLLPVCEGRENAAFAAAAEELRPDCSGVRQQLRFGVKDADESHGVRLQPAGETGPLTAEMQEDGPAVSLQLLCSYREEFSVNKQLEWNQERKDECFSAKADDSDVLFLEKETQNSSTRLKTQMTFSSGYNACTDQSKLDHNANITLSAELPCKPKLPPQSAALLSSQTTPLIFNSAESCRSPPGQDEEFPASTPKCSHTSTDDTHPAADQPKSSSRHISLTTSPPEQNEEADPPPPARQGRSKTRRKQAHPSRSGDIQDPDFQGVTFRIDAALDDTREQCRLLITSKYSKELGRGVRKPKQRTRTSQKSLKASSSDEENDLTAAVLKNKVCASCCTRKTPMWRDAEDGTPLCNACGIRYKKYRVRCVKCWHIPRKEGNSNSRCLKCGNFVKLTSAQRKHSS
ncbi:GATA-type zinc finger protein 1 [Kryptolebias marmoratus]|uniref:GATA-type zinc finger protein 1 n=1 Tax=Kryptolebias marmoratus TaxID=37003 RepID=UPI0007F8B441|nr:GATA-type zinc finger protein 1 [Kryptolebias marmoratus]XP_024864932.1 GATA-type zinc finger protein 1 [Kryptolebias marmoratus]XP_024864933.1 GATA-type zinc finger protein 1 [Kryptolebias marmoratus]